MKKRLRVIVLLAIAVFVLIQVVRPEQTNPAIHPEQTIEANMRVPAGADAIINRACRDCHTNSTVWKWYGNFAPVSWLMVSDVNSGRKKMNFSQWTDLSKGQQEDRLKGICDEVQSGGMPLWFYRPLHPEARLSDADKQTLCDWTKSALTTPALTAPPTH
jgi:hypothetical protein